LIHFYKRKIFRFVQPLERNLIDPIDI